MTDRNIMLDIYRDAAGFYRSYLAGPEGEKAREFLKQRGISPETAARFGIGCAPDSKDALRDKLTRKYRYEDLFRAGLLKRRSMVNPFHDTFRNRIMFPMTDEDGNIVSFTGRMLDGGYEPVYLRLSCDLAGHRTVFALNIARQTGNGRLILVEGEMDVVALHQAGFRETVSVLGTGVTDEQAETMARHAKNAVIVYDSDTYGQNSAESAVPVLERAGMSVKVIRLEGAKDPQEYIRTKGAAAFSELIG